MILVAALLLAAGLSSIATPAARACAERLGVLDHPGARKPHRRATARLGGPAVVLSAAASLGVLAPVTPDARDRLWPMLVGAGLVFVIGLWDDVRGVSAVVKLLAEAAAAAVVIAGGVTIDRVTFAGATYDLGLMSVPITLIWVVALTNAFNLIDGLDGLAAGLAVIAAVTCGSILVARGHLAEATILVGLLGALLGFLPYNFHPASIFLGDSGSLVIGFVLSVTAIMGWQKGATALAVGVPLLIFAVPLLDTVTAVTRRIARRRESALMPSRRAGLGRVLEPDQEHIHHRLVARGLSHRAAVLVLYATALALSALALLTVRMP